MAQRWRADEDSVVAQMYADGVSLRAIATRLGRSEDAVTSRRRALGIGDRRLVWSPGRDALIVAAADAGIPASEIAIRLGVSADRVRRRRATLIGARDASPRYTAQEDAAIRHRWPAVSMLSVELGRSPEAIRLHARALGLHRPVQRRRWSPAEDAAVRDGYRHGLSCQQVASILEGRTVGAVQARAGKLGVGIYGRLWSHRDDRRLAQMARHDLPVDAIAQRLVRTAEAIRQRAQKLGLDGLAPATAAQAGRPWTAEADALLGELADADPSRVARALGRSDRAVLGRLTYLGLMREPARTPHRGLPRLTGLSPGERVVIEREAVGASGRRVAAVARRLALSPGEVRRTASDLGSAA
ncbi:MAG: hypothetical protein NVSMB25_12150 [Thermoleophilaceae bacterium]